MTSSVTVMLVAGGGLFSSLISWYDGGWAHMASILPDGSVIDAQDEAITIDGVTYQAGVQRRPAGYLDTEPRWIKLEIPCAAAQSVTWQNALKSQLGKAYDTEAILRFAEGGGADRNWRGDGAENLAWICSALAVWALEEAEIVPRLTVPAYRIDPGDGALIAEAVGGLVVASRGVELDV